MAGIAAGGIAAARKIAGFLLLDQGPMPEPLAFQTLVLFRGGREFLRAISDADGNFVFAGDIQNGSYTIKLISDRYTADTTVDVSSFSLGDVRVMAKPV